jgi:hypothetical protein
MIEIIPPVDKKLLKAELTKEKFIRATNNGNNELYVFTANDSPNLMREIGRLRELTFRDAGGGTGKDCDIDPFDEAEIPYKQLIVWEPKEKEILGGYRYFICSEKSYNSTEKPALATGRLFNFSDEFKKEYLPFTAELGRSFVQPKFQSTKRHKKAIYALDNLWDGLGTLVVDYPQMKYFFGKVTMYRRYNPYARNLILYFLEKHFADKDSLVWPKQSLNTSIEKSKLAEIICTDNYMEDYKILSKNVRALGEFIPPLINAYMNLSPTMRYFGTVINDHFGDVEESAILVTIKDINSDKAERHISTYISIRD